jgi:hypothetical protein
MVRGTRFGKISEGIVTAFGGVRGAQNVAAWGVAGIVAYYLWIKPERELRLEQEEVQHPSSFKQAHSCCNMHTLSLSLSLSLSVSELLWSWRQEGIFFPHEPFLYLAFVIVS